MQDIYSLQRSGYGNGRSKNRTVDDSTGWNEDRHSIDNNSQKKILGLKSSLEEQYVSEVRTDPARKPPSNAILATTEVEVQHSSVSDDNLGTSAVKIGGEW